MSKFVMQSIAEFFKKVNVYIDKWFILWLQYLHRDHHTLWSNDMLMPISQWTSAEVHHDGTTVSQIVLRSDDHSNEVTFAEVTRLESRFRVKVGGPVLDLRSVSDKDLGEALQLAHFDGHAIAVFIVAFTVPVTQRSGWDMDFSLGENTHCVLRSSGFPTETTFIPPVDWT